MSHQINYWQKYQKYKAKYLNLVGGVGQVKQVTKKEALAGAAAAAAASAALLFGSQKLFKDVYDRIGNLYKAMYQLKNKLDNGFTAEQTAESTSAFNEEFYNKVVLELNSIEAEFKTKLGESEEKTNNKIKELQQNILTRIILIHNTVFKMTITKETKKDITQQIDIAHKIITKFNNTLDTLIKLRDTYAASLPSKKPVSE